MGAYSAVFQRTASAAASVGTVGVSATARRILLYRMVFGCEGTPADNAFLWTVSRCTALGTSTAVTPKPLDPADPACAAVAGQNHTVEPTYTANETLLAVPMHQRSTFQMELAPRRELIVPATAANGLGVRTPTMTALTITATIHFQE